MRIALGLLLFLTFFVGCGSLTRYISHVQNFVNLVSSYNLDGYSTIDFPPLADVSQAMNVNVNIHLYAVNGFDEVAGNIELVVALEMSWVDEMSIIQSISFKIEDRKEFLVPFDMIWTPKLVLTNAIGETSDVGDSAYLCRFDMSTKQITWKPRVVVSGSCTPDVTFYPFDKQECEFVYTAWGFKADEIFLTSSTNEWNLAEYGESGEWDIDSTSTESYVLNDQSYIKFKLVMVRKPLYFAFNILLPILVLCLLNSTVFLLPAESGERVGFSVTCFLSFMVLLNMIMDIMPRSSNPISFLCYYLVVMMSNSGAMTLVTILLMRVYHKPEKSKVPKWMQRAVTFVNCGCARLRCCVLCCRYIRNNCCCTDKRKCGCKKKRKSNSEETLTEITIDKDQNIIEKPVKKKNLEKRGDNEESTNSKLPCFLSCVKNDKTSNSKCCCGMICGCKKCKKTEDENSERFKNESNTNASSVCNGFFRCRKRRNENIVENIEKENQDSKTEKHLLNENETEECAETRSVARFLGFCKKAKQNKDDIVIKEPKSCCNFASKEKAKTENTSGDKTVDVTCITCFGEGRGKVSRLNKSEGNSLVSEKHVMETEKTCGDDTSKITTITKEDFKAEDSKNPDCFAFCRKSKISSYDEADIENDVLPVSERSQDSKTLKVSFKGKEKLETEEKLLQRWEDTSKDVTANKKKSSLNPIDPKKKNDEEKETNVESEDDETNEVTLKTKSIHAGSKEKEEQRKINIKSEVENSDLDLEIVRKTRTHRRASEKEKLPKPVVQGSARIPSERRKSTMSKTSLYSDDESVESEVDSLADLEEEVTWPEVGRILDTFFFLAFSGGQAFLTVVFLVPLFTGDKKSSEN